jgi:hypothetical protein
MVASQRSRWVNSQASYACYDLIICPQRSVDAQWIVAKKDWREAKRRYKEQERKDSKGPGEQNGHETPNGGDHAGDHAGSDHDDTESGSYQQDMDEMRCILYSHGGAAHVLVISMPDT